MRLYITKAEDRDTVLMILGRNGYTVRQGKERKENKTVTFVEVVEDGK
jgi:hypothetical protein